MITVAWRSDTGAVLRSCIAVHVVTVIVAITHVRIAMVDIRATPHIGITVVQVIGAECELRSDDKGGHLLHVGHAAHVPRTNVLVKHRRLTEHLTVRPHAAHGGRKEKQGHSVRSRYTATVWGSGSERIICS